MRYSIGQQEAIEITNLVDDAGTPIAAETLTGFAISPHGDTYALTSTNPSANNYRILGPTFDLAGRWHWWLTGTTPNVGFQGEWLVDWSPAAP